MTKGKIGLNSGIIWNLMTNRVQVCAEELQKQASLTSVEFWAAIGWLARENKVEITEEESRLVISSGTNFFF